MINIKLLAFILGSLTAAISVFAQGLSNEELHQNQTAHRYFQLNIVATATVEPIEHELKTAAQRAKFRAMKLAAAEMNRQCTLDYKGVLVSPFYLSEYAPSRIVEAGKHWERAEITSTAVCKLDSSTPNLFVWESASEDLIFPYSIETQTFRSLLQGSNQ